MRASAWPELPCCSTQHLRNCAQFKTSTSTLRTSSDDPFGSDSALRRSQSCAQGHLNRVGDERCAFVRAMVFANRAMATRANLEREARNWIDAEGTTPPGNGGIDTKYVVVCLHALSRLLPC